MLPTLYMFRWRLCFLPIYFALRLVYVIRYVPFRSVLLNLRDHVVWIALYLSDIVSRIWYLASGSAPSHLHVRRSLVRSPAYLHIYIRHRPDPPPFFAPPIPPPWH